MAKNHLALIPGNVINPSGITFANADGATDTTGSTNTKTLVTAGADDSVIRYINITSDELTANNRDVMFFMNNGTTSYLVAIINVPFSSGFATGIGSVNALDRALWKGLPVDADGNPYLKLKSGWTLKAGMKVAVTSTKLVTITAISEDY